MLHRQSQTRVRLVRTVDVVNAILHVPCCLAIAQVMALDVAQSRYVAHFDSTFSACRICNNFVDHKCDGNNSLFIFMFIYKWIIYDRD